MAFAPPSHFTPASSGAMTPPHLSTRYQVITSRPYTLPRGVHYRPIAWRFTLDGGCPVPLGGSLSRNLDYLDNPKDRLFAECGTKVTYRVLVDEYPDFYKQMNAQRRKGGKAVPILRSKVVKQIAQVVSKFIDGASKMTSNSELRFGPGFITIDQIYLVELRQVSPASFQPILAVMTPAPPQVPAQGAMEEFVAPLGGDIPYYPLAPLDSASLTLDMAPLPLDTAPMSFVNEPVLRMQEHIAALASPVSPGSFTYGTQALVEPESGIAYTDEAADLTNFWQSFTGSSSYPACGGF